MFYHKKESWEVEKLEAGENVKKLLGKRIQELRIAKNLTQGELADKIDLAERNVSKIECGENFVRAQTLAKLAKALNVKIAELFEFEHLENIKKVKNEIFFEIERNPENARLVYRLFRAINS